MGKVVIIEGRKFEGEQEIAAANADKAAIDKIKSQMDHMSLSDLKLLSKKLHSGRINFGTKLGDDFIEDIDSIIESMEKKESLSEEKSEIRTTQRKTDNRETKKTEDPDIDAQARKILEKQEKTRKAVLFASLFVAAACILYIVIYNVTRMRSARTTDLLSGIREQATNEALLGNTGNSSPDDGQVVIHYTDEEETPEILPEYLDIYNKNKRLIGWLEIADINGEAFISYPVMQTVDNEYYLTHGFNQENDVNGCIFMDCNCDAIKPSDNLILYGHHMRSGRMFGNLVRYEDESFYKTHRIIKFDTIYEHGEYEVMFAFRTSLKYENDISFKYYQFIDANGPEEFASYMNEMASMSLYDTGVTAVWGDHLLTLSTCDYQEDNGRFAVVARRID
ncbi:MAG: class B sortase [Lachnospiraceae bacterium]|nr:class B sortase [Lachnospiraceae bacterium]